MVVGLILATGASVTAGVFVVQVAVLPLLFRYNKSIQRKIVFSNCFNYPRNLDYENPSSSDIIGGRNFNIEFHSQVDDCEIKLDMYGALACTTYTIFLSVWHMIPCTMFREVFVIRDYKNLESRLHKELKKTKNTIVLYCHGNSNHRASPHRLQMYKLFQELNFHVIAFDYRGYGDSTPIRPTEAGVVEDALAVYSWLVDNLESNPKPVILLWGHSLGTAVAGNLVANMDDLCRRNGKPTNMLRPSALVLEAPFNNLVEEISSHPITKLVSWLPYFRETFVKPFCGCPEYCFATDEYLTKVPDIPILILHSECDRIVPYELAVKLYNTVKDSRGEQGAPITLHTFNKRQRLGHNNICEAKDLKSIIGNFMKSVDLKPPENYNKEPSVFLIKTNSEDVVKKSRHDLHKPSTKKIDRNQTLECTKKDNKNVCPTDTDVNMLQIMKACQPCLSKGDILHSTERGPKKKPSKTGAKIILAIRNYEVSSEEFMQSMYLDIPVKVDSIPSVHVAFLTKHNKKQAHKSRKCKIENQNALLLGKST